MSHFMRGVLAGFALSFLLVAGQAGGEPEDVREALLQAETGTVEVTVIRQGRELTLTQGI